jgi:tetratricopeptide (TPR) repeat protein
MEARQTQDSSPSRGCAALWAALARLIMATDRTPEEELKAADHAVDLARTVGDVSIELGAEVTRADALWKLGREDEALRTLEDVIPRAELAGDLMNLARALSNAADLYSRRGELAKDRWYLERAQEVLERRGDRGQIVSESISLSTNAYLTGDWARSREYLERAEGMIRSLGTIRLSSWPTMARGWLSLREGDLQAASAAAEEILRQKEAPTEYHQLARRLLAETELLADDPQAAAADLIPALGGTSWDRDPGFLRTLAWVHLALGDVAGADKLAAKAIVRTAVQNDQLDRVETLIVHGMVKTRQGRWTAAERMFREALELAGPMPFPYGEARALFELGLMLRQKGDADGAWERLREALAIFERLGARLDVERTEQALAELPVAVSP